MDGTIAAFNTGGRLTYLQDTNGNRITAGYTGGRLTSLTATSGQSISLAYNAAGLLSTVTDSAGRATTYSYDATNQHLLSVRAYNGFVTSYIYETNAGSPSRNAPTPITFPDNTHQYFTYDSQGRLSGTSADGGAESQTLTYALGLVRITDAASNTSQLYFNQNGQLARALDALGNSTYFNYDSVFNLTGVTNASGASATYTYNQARQVTTVTDYLGNITNLTYGGSHNQLSALTDANGNTTQYVYNATGNLLSTTYANGRSKPIPTTRWATPHRL